MQASEELDDGSQLKVMIEIKSNARAHIDFSGSAPVHAGNLNGTEAVCLSVLMYALRVWVNEAIPLNDGMLDPVEVTLPECILNPRFGDDPLLCPAVAAGNVELSQRLADTLFKALGIAAASQGTMNNLLFGDTSFGYYETIGGGGGAGPGHAGTDAAHQHMTNTRITDVELMEQRYPVRVWRFAVRSESGGQGQYPGGDGIIREVEFLAPLTVSVIAQRRQSGPYGLNGGAPGRPGCQTLICPDGTRLPFESSQSVEVKPGTRLVIETPGGGGWGRPPA
jgi:5-oxoprolinase (ATP-hydrolysing)